MQTTRIEGRVAQVLDDRQLVINRGEADGVRRGMKFEILAAESVQITDPETGQLLDELDRVKVRVQAIEVRERVTVCASYERHPRPSHFDDPRVREMLYGALVTLPVAPSQQLPMLDPEHSFVARGDRAIQLIDPADN